MKLLLLLALLLPASTLWANPAGTGWVRDHAEILNPATRAHLETLLDEVQRQTSAEVMVITVDSLHGQDIDSFATQLFNQIGIGRRDTNNGVLFLTAPNERRTRIEVGYGLEPLITDARAGRILDTHVLPHFLRNDMEAGIVAGTDAIAELLRTNPDAARGISGSGSVRMQSAETALEQALYGLLVLAALLFGLFFIIRRRRRFPVPLLFVAAALTLAVIVFVITRWQALGAYDRVPTVLPVLGGLALLVSALLNGRLFLRYRPRACPHCRTPMRLLSEQEEDPHLNETQQLEEHLHAVDYDVWYCPACLKTRTERYVEFNSGYRACPKCKAHAYSETTITLVAATYSSGGKEQVDGQCKACGHTRSRIRSTPRLTHSSSSGGGGGGSSGGGSSGGGGASRSW